MFIPTPIRISIYTHLFNEGVVVAKKDFNAPKHPDIEGASNLQVIKLMTSLKSRKYVREQYAWRHYYWFLTNEGTEFLRDFLHLEPEVVPKTHRRTDHTKNVLHSLERRPRGGGVRRGGGRGRGAGAGAGAGERGGYRRDSRRGFGGAARQ
eukprot:gb/GECH01011228.1/.p1 GENE.gb/GECH01011228.1/~~gb/GECH01011228.1/.p1  ORF type:complete len:151 (+),score=28.06 gb/GECH01011228.1/:1-453(+)